MRYTRIALALLVVFASVLGTVAVTPSAAQTSDYSKTFTDTGNVRYVGFSTDGWSADTFRVRISTVDGPGGSKVVLYNETHTTAEMEGGWNGQVFENGGAYDQITIEVLGAANQPEFGVGSHFDEIQFRNSDQFGSTGGDRDLVADPGEKLAMTLNPAVNIVDVSRDFQRVNESELSSLDASEKKLEIYQDAASSADTAQTVHAMMNNNLQDAETVALIKGKNAYIRSLNEAGSKSTAEAQAKGNISDYYSRQERNLISQWNSQMSRLKYLRSLAVNETGVSQWYISVLAEDDTSTIKDAIETNVTGFGSTTYTLQNGTTVDVTTVKVQAEDTSFSYTGSPPVFEFGPTTGSKQDVDVYAGENQPDDNDTPDLQQIVVFPPESNYERKMVVSFDEYSSALSTIDTQTTSAQGQMETVVNQTYDQYQAGDINSSDLIDPYVLQNKYSPGSEFQSWAAATLAMGGSNQPVDFDQTGYMNVTLSDGTQYQGVLHVPHNPPSGEFSNETTYYPSNFTGPIYITTDSKVREINQAFTLDEIRTLDGQQKANVTYVEKNYTTTSAEDLQKLHQQLAEVRAEIEAREQSLGGGGALFGSGSSGPVILIVLAGAVVALMMRDDDGNGGNSNGGGRRSRRRY